MNILILGKAKTGTTVISQAILNSLEGESEYLFEPHGAEAFQKDFGNAHVVAKVLFNHWEGRHNALLECISGGKTLNFDKRIFLVRDPRDEAISTLLYYAFSLKNYVKGNAAFNEWIGFLKQKEQSPHDISFIAMCQKFDSLFDANFTASLLKFNTIDGGYTRFRDLFKGNHLVYKYEDFMSCDTMILGKYLGIEITDKRDVSEEYSQVRRSGSHSNWKRYFTPEDVHFFRKHDSYFQMLGYSDWELTPPESIPEEEMSQYVMNLLLR